MRRFVNAVKAGKTRRRILIALTVVAALALFIGVTIRFLIERSVRVDQVESVASAALGRHLSASSVEVSAIYGLVLRDVQIDDAPDSALSRTANRAASRTAGDTGFLLRAVVVRVRPSWWQLIRGKFVVASIRLIDADAWIRKTPSGWNWLQLRSELAARPTAGPEPTFISDDLRLHVEAPGNRAHGWLVNLSRVVITPGARRIEVTANRFADRDLQFTVKARPPEGRAEFTFRDVPPEWMEAAGIPHRAEGLAGRATLDWRPTTVAGALPDTMAVSATIEGRRLTLNLGKSGFGQVENFRTRHVAGHWDLVRADWDVTIDDLLIGATDNALRVTAFLAGRGAGTRQARVEWDGPMDRLLALAPTALVANILRYHPRGSSTGRLQWTDRAPGKAEVTVLARGMGLSIPRGSVVAGSSAAPGGTTQSGALRSSAILPANDVTLTDIRGRVRLLGDVITLDTVSARWDGDQFSVDGHWNRAVALPDYDLLVRTGSFAAERVAALLPDAMTVRGRIGASVRVQPRAVWGNVAFHNAVLSHPAIAAPLTLVGGLVEFSRDHKLTMHDIAVAAGRGHVNVSGTISPDEVLDLDASLEAAELTTLAPHMGNYLASQGIKLLGGSADGRISLAGRAGKIEAMGSVALQQAAITALEQNWTAIEGPLHFDSTGIVTPGLSARLGEGSLHVSGAYGATEARLVVHLNRLEAAALNPLVARAGQNLAMSGPLDASLNLTNHRGAWTTDGTLTFRGTSLARAERFSFQNLTGAVDLTPDHVTAHDVAGTYQGAPCRLQGELPLTDAGVFSLAIAFDRIRFDHFAEFLPEGYTASGAAENLVLALSGPRGSPEVSGSVHFTGASLKLPFLAAGMSDVRGGAAFSPDSFAARNITFHVGNSTVKVSGAVEKFDKPMFHGITLAGENVQLADLISLLPEHNRPLPTGATLTGAATFDNVTINGPIDHAEWGGSLEIRDGALQLPGLTRGVTGITGRFVMGDGKLRATSIAGRIGAAETRFEGEMELSSPYKLAVRLAIREADLGDLFASMPKSEAAARIALKGHGTLTTTLDFDGRRILVIGHLSEAEAEAVGLSFKDVSGAFRYDGAAGALTLSELSGAWAGGRADHGAARIQLSTSPWTYDVEASLRGVDLAEALTQAGFASRGYAGRVDADLALSGRAGELGSVNGAGTMKVTQARFEALQPIDGISRTLRMDFFSRGTYESARGSFVLDKGVLRTTDPDHFLFLGRNYTLQARGYAELEGPYAFNYACGISAGLVGNLLSTLQIGRLFSMEGDHGILRTAGAVTGRFGQPPVVTRDLNLLGSFPR